MKLVGVRHKDHLYMSREHPAYKQAVAEPNKLTKVDEIEVWQGPDGNQRWISILFYLPNNKIGDLQVRTQDCDQFYYLREDK